MRHLWVIAKQLDRRLVRLGGRCCVARSESRLAHARRRATR
ncbi:MAG TPA: hypothetical protein VFU26_01780 [Gaiellaceae bacterium]|nr:hypothetical protein [Gaiellaceae bacterium]